MKKLENFSRAGNSKGGSSHWKSSSLSFLSNWTAPVDEDHLDELTNTGLREAKRLGRTLRNRYQDLNKPRQVWSSTAERTVKTAKGFIEGFNIGGHNSTIMKTDSTRTKINLTTVEESEEAGADSLTPYKGCGAYSSSYGNDQSSVCHLPLHFGMTLHILKYPGTLSFLLTKISDLHKNLHKIHNPTS